MDLDSDLPPRARSLGADYYDGADVGSAQEFIRVQGGDRVARYPRAVVMGIRLLDTLVDRVEDRNDRTGATLYHHFGYHVVNTAMEAIALQVAKTIQQKGYRTLPIPASKRANDELIAGVFSQKLAAHLAGLGWIGKNCLLDTPDHGPRVRWIAMLTDAPLVPTGKPMEPRCGKCVECVDICPVHADEPRKARFDAALCDRYFKEIGTGSGPGVCGLCLYVCPFGRKGTYHSAGKERE